MPSEIAGGYVRLQKSGTESRFCMFLWQHEKQSHLAKSMQLTVWVPWYGRFPPSAPCNFVEIQSAASSMSNSTLPLHAEMNELCECLPLFQPLTSLLPRIIPERLNVLRIFRSFSHSIPPQNTFFCLSLSPPCFSLNKRIMFFPQNMDHHGSPTKPTLLSSMNQVPPTTRAPARAFGLMRRI